MSVSGEPDTAAEAFDHLRAEVSLLRRAVEGLTANQPEAPVDYAPTLARLVKQMEAIEDSVGTLAGSPYLAYTPDALAAQIQAIVMRTRQEAASDLRQAIDQFGRATTALVGVMGQARTRDSQRRGLLYAASGGAVSALAAWLLLSGPVVRALPSAWQVPERMAAATLGEARWPAGARLMARADPQRWRQIALGDELLGRNRATLEACRARVEKTGRSSNCDVRVDPGP